MPCLASAVSAGSLQTVHSRRVNLQDAQKIW